MSSGLRTGIDLIGRELTFTQRRLLAPSRFEREARDRGVTLWGGDLERLHRAGILVPLYWVRRPRWDIEKRKASVARGSPPDRSWGVPTDGFELREDQRAGLVALGAEHRYRAWQREVIQLPTGTIHRGHYLYSPWQLLDLVRIETVLGHLRRRPDERTRWARMGLRAARRRRSISDIRTVLLSALEARYYPRIVQRTSMPAHRGLEAWDEFDRTFDARELSEWLGWSTADLYAQARAMLLTASSIDPLDAWIDLVNQIAPDRWWRLKGDARLAIDLRIGGEMVLRFLESLQRVGLAPEFEAVPRLAPHPLNERLRQDRSHLDEALSAFGLSPYPSVVLALEGETEMAVVPRVMEELAIPIRDSFIRLVRTGGEDRDHSLLAEYVALPKLAPPEGGVAEFIRPPTRYYIAVDGDRRYRTPASREAERARWVKVLAAALDPELRTTEALVEIDNLVVVDAWGDGVDFERAHFSDAELAAALEACGRVPIGMTRADLEVRLSTSRAKGTGLGKVWADWPTQPSKVELADALWPVLRRRLRRKRSRGGLGLIPVARIVLRALDFAAQTPRRNVVFRVGTADAEERSIP